MNSLKVGASSIFYTTYLLDARPRQSKIQPFINLLLAIMKSNYTPDKQVPVDAAVITFRGRVSFREYIKVNLTHGVYKLKYCLTSSLDICTTYLYIMVKIIIPFNTSTGLL